MTLRTIENNKFIQKKAPLRARLYAFTIDLILITFITILINFAFISYLQTLSMGLPSEVQNFFLKSITINSTYIIALVTFGYFFVSYLLLNGKTIGKKLLKLEILNKNNQPLSTTQIVARATAYSLCFIINPLLLFIPLLDRLDRGIPDFLSQTSVVQSTEDKNYKIKQNDLFEDKWAA